MSHQVDSPAPAAAAPDANQRRGLQLVGRVADILRALETYCSGATLAQLSAAAGLQKSTTHRVLGALEAERLVSRGPGGFRLGPLLARLGAVSSKTLRDEIRPYMTRRPQDLQETVAILDGEGVRFIDQITGPQRLRAVSAIGQVSPLHCTANGKALLAALPRQQASGLLPARVPALTKHTITSERELYKELDEIALTGLALDREEHTEGICAVGVTVRDAFGAPLAITVALPTQRFRGRESAIKKMLLATKAQATERLDGGE